ncbi:calpain-C [Sitodiplosis mosellana]|uniref:calpain-C n=1 Tax=Sitodiplosis mosellana TaxID=263140 RepID=UPI002444D81F|nr:calpain-C [Sitodiplosis mosellana]XP_055314693.1 calpain-C [Sitodiplosis mosellana]XP_055314694.1 calpain-C [Sitodiplosis mosellana]
MTSKYDRIKSECKRKNILWEDPDFQAVQSSVFYYQTPPFTFQWKRISEIVQSPLFINDGEQFDIIPGKMGDRWLVSCLGVLFSLKNLFYRVVPADQNFENYHGVFRFRLWWCGEWVEVLVDDRLPTINGKLSFLQPLKSNCFWAALLEKAIAKLHGSYEALKYGTRSDGLSDLTGGVVETIPVKSGSDSIRPAILRSILDTTCIITCIAIRGNSSQFKSQPEKFPNGIAIGVSYRLCSLDKVENTMGDSVQLVRLKDPMTSDALGLKTGFTGEWSATSPLWERCSEQERDRLLGQLDANEFWMSFLALTETFTNLECIHLDTDTAKDELSLSDRPRRWSMKMFQGFWRKGVTAGGCRNHDSFHINPQLQLFVAEKEDVIIALNQHTAVEPKVIGFTMYKLNSIKNKLTENLSKEFFKNQVSFINSDYGNSRHVSYRCNLEAGRYLLMATTYEPGEESGFTVRMLGNHIKLAQLETQTMMILDPFPPLSVTQQRNDTDTTKKKCQYEPIFMQLADENRTINSFELQELLDACLPNDYIKSCASIDICRQVVSLLDKTGHGRINFMQFKTFIANLKAWQGVFKMYSKEKAGILRAERLRDALYDVGFQLSSEIMSIIMLKYMRKDGTLRLGDFASAILHLTTAFEVFQRKDHDQDNLIKIEMADWIKSVLRC